jgi:cyclophilin family peptidyl-prolyl cis-trans isomerase
MRRLVSKLRDLFSNRPVRGIEPRRRRLEVEALEDRTLLSGNASGTIMGTAFIDPTGSGTLTANSFLLPGASLTLTGTTIVGVGVNVTASTDQGGNYVFNNVQPGTYQLSVAAVPSLVGSPGIAGSPSATVQITMTGDQTVTEDLVFGGLAPQFISLRQFLATSTPSNISGLPSPGSGSAAASSRPNSAPTVAKPIPSFMGHPNGDTIDLAGFFTDPDITDTFVRFDTSAGPINVELFDSQAPQTVANFLNYVLAGDYNNTIFHRLTSQSADGLAVLQGGGFGLSGNPLTFPPVPTLGFSDPALGQAHVLGANGQFSIGLPNEFGIPNSTGTLAMAKLSDPNSASNEFFFNTGDNASTLGPQNSGGFTVFGKVVSDADMQVLNTLAPQIQSSSTVQTFNQGKTNSAFTELPLTNYNGTNFPNDATTSNFEVINDVQIVSRNEALKYSVVGNSNPGLVSTSIASNSPYLNLTYAADQTGTATITVQATDQFGATVQSSFNVTIAPPSVALALNNTSPTVADTLTATATPTGPGGQGAIALKFVWTDTTNGAVLKTDTINGTSGAASTDTLNLSTLSNVSKGDAITVSVTPSDSAFTGTAATASAQVVNFVPVVDSVAIAPTSPTVSTTSLTTTVNSHDADKGDTNTLTLVYTVNGKTVATHTATVTAGTPTTDTLDTTSLGLTKGQTISVSVTASDGTATSAAVTSSATVA